MLEISTEAARLQITLQGAPIAYSYFDAADRLLFWNRAYQDLNFQIRTLIKKGAFFPDLLAELVVRNQIQIDGSCQEWVSERLAARKYGNTAFRALTDGRTFLVQERKDDVGGTLGFWVNVTDLVKSGALRGTPTNLEGMQLTIADHGQQILLREKLQTVLGCLDLLRLSNASKECAQLIDEAATASQELREILDSLR